MFSRTLALCFNALQDELKTSIKEKQQDAVTQLEQHAEERTQIEADIYKATMKLEHVNKENQRFEEVWIFEVWVLFCRTAAH